MANKNVSCKLLIKNIYLERDDLCKLLFIATEDYLCILTYSYMTNGSNVCLMQPLTQEIADCSVTSIFFKFLLLHVIDMRLSGFERKCFSINSSINVF